MGATKEWFGAWFDSPYYHILYKHRDEEEARDFINNLHRFLKFKGSDKILDVACGKGRHAIFLNQIGMDVVGLDLSPQNIKYASQFENPRLKFFVHDMREVFRSEQFDLALNLFTSFGYFDTEEENEKAICATAQALKKGGKLVVDFLNPYTVIDRLVPCEQLTQEGIQFEINRSYQQGFILKEIKFTDKGHQYVFTERVRAIRKIEFMRYFVKAGLRLYGTFGDYDLNPYQWETSGRMIFIMEKY